MCKTGHRVRTCMRSLAPFCCLHFAALAHWLSQLRSSTHSSPQLTVSRVLQTKDGGSVLVYAHYTPITVYPHYTPRINSVKDAAALGAHTFQRAILSEHDMERVVSPRPGLVRNMPCS
jgi:hypothetical protein